MVPLPHFCVHVKVVLQQDTKGWRRRRRRRKQRMKMGD